MPVAPWERGLVMDFGAGGLGFQCDVRFERGQVLDMHIDLPNTGELLMVRGQVVRFESPAAGTYEYGLAFEDPTPDQQAQIDDLVQFLRKKPGSL